MKTTAALLIGLILCSGALCLPVAPHPECQEGASFQGLGQPDDSTLYRSAVAVSGDGRVVLAEEIAFDSTPSDLETAGTPIKIMRWIDGVASELSLPDGAEIGFAGAISRDGSVVATTLTIAQVTSGYRWTSAEGFVALVDDPGTTSSAYAQGISADGSVVVGARFTDQLHSAREACLWRSDQSRVTLGDLPGGNIFGAATAVSNDGAVVVGTGSTDASAWAAFRWTVEAGMVALSGLPEGHANTTPVAVSADGLVVVGSIYTFGEEDGDNRWRAFRWTEADGIVLLDELYEGMVGSNATAASASAGTIVGFNTLLKVDDLAARNDSWIAATGVRPRYVYRAFVWDQASGMRSLQDVLENDYGLDLSGWTLVGATGISEDGLTIVGNGVNPDGHGEAWVARLPAPP